MTFAAGLSQTGTVKFRSCTLRRDNVVRSMALFAGYRQGRIVHFRGQHRGMERMFCRCIIMTCQAIHRLYFLFVRNILSVESGMTRRADKLSVR